jgi:carbamoyl-phosphate synthase large subunit
MRMLNNPSSERQFILYEAIRQGASLEELYRKTYIKPWFLHQMKELVDLEEEILKFRGKEIPDALLIQAKKDGFADKYLAKLLDQPEAVLRDRRIALGLEEAWEPVPVSGVKEAAYYYSTYNAPDRVTVSPRKKIMVLGGGPNRIGQGIEFDYCCVHAAFAIRDSGFESIMVNCNPETVSTDYDTSDKLYFEPYLQERGSGRGDCAIRGADAAEHSHGVVAPWGEDPRHFPGHHRFGGGPRPFSPGDAPAGHPAA